MKKKDVPILYKNKEECCGCAVCYAVCSKAAIKMIMDEEGFDYPEIDQMKCIKCWQCVSVCPI